MVILDDNTNTIKVVENIDLKIKSLKSNYYLDPQDLMNEYLLSIKQDKCSDKLIKYFEIIARHLSRIFYYSSENDKQSCVNYAISEAWIKWKKYDPVRTPNIFSFFTTTIKNDMQTHYNYLTRHSENISIDSLFTNNTDK
jgi:hypothetical protein